MAARLSSRSGNRQVSHPGMLGRLLDPIDRLSETIYSVLIILTFTLAYAVSRPDFPPGQPIPASYTDSLAGAVLGAALAWGLIDGMMYALIELFQRGERHRMLEQIQTAPSEEEGVAIIADEFDYVLDPIAGETERRELYQRVYAKLRESRPRPVGFRPEDFTGALGSTLVAVLAVVPSIIPLLIFRNDFFLALRVSNAVSFVVLFAAGFSWGRHTGANPWRTGLLLVAFAAAMVAIALPLGG